MNGYELFDSAIIRLGYNESVKDTLMPRAKELINQILLDLKLNTVNALTDEISYETNILEGIRCGLAMLLALSESDGEKQKIFSEIYNGKRGSILSENCRVEDRLPKAEGGDF